MSKVEQKQDYSFTRVVTHSGVFHVDEVLALALLINLDVIPNNQEITRVEEVPEEWLDDPGTLVIDVGGRFEPENNNFDHHHDKSLPAACMLVLEHFVTEDRVKKSLKNRLFDHASLVDLGQKKPEAGHIETLIKSLNQVENSFPAALAALTYFVKGMIIEINKVKETFDLYKKLPREFGGKLVINDTGKHLMGWRWAANRAPFSKRPILMLTPSTREEGQWNLVVNDLHIPPHDSQIFRHEMGQIASYPDYDTALNHAKEIIENKKRK